MSPEFEEWLKKQQEELDARKQIEGAEIEGGAELDAEDEGILDQAWEKVRESEEEAE